jgi:hypothetical protein
VTVQYRVVVTKKDERILGPDDADVVMAVPLAEVRAEGFDPTVAYMRGVLKATGPSRVVFDVLRSGEAAAAFASLVGDD